MEIKNKNGITLISVVVTIILLLILSTVSISQITSKNGILTKSILAKQMSQTSSEKEALQLNITLAQMENSLTSSNKYYIGTPLYDRTLANGNKWNIIINENGDTYGTDWNYILKGTELYDYGPLQNNWLVNYKSGQIEELQENGYSNLKYGNNLAVTDNLILNVDPFSMSDSSSWGDNVKLYGVENGDGYGWNESEIKLDGVDDYIEIYTDKFQANQGLTFEFYAQNKNEILNDDMPILSKSLPQSQYSGIRFLLANNCIQLSMNMVDSLSDWSPSSNLKHWIYKNITQDFQSDEGGYITLVINIDKNLVSLYENGNFIDSTTVSHAWINSDILENSSVPFLIGKRYGYEIDSVINRYGKMNIYACRLYNKVLNDNEIKENYNKTVTYHNMLSKK